ncbi:MAG: RCC1 domain-containing protein [Sandaracinaceae bacterium]
MKVARIGLLALSLALGGCDLVLGLDNYHAGDAGPDAGGTDAGVRDAAGMDAAGTDAGAATDAGTTDDAGRPIDPLAPSPIVAGFEHVCARDPMNEDRTLCWGARSNFRLGDDDMGPSETCLPMAGGTACLSGPTHPVVDASTNPLGRVRRMVATRSSTCAILEEDGAAYCWGQHEAYGTDFGPHATPLQIDTSVGGTRPLENVVSIALTELHGCVIEDRDGMVSIYCWGENSAGELGDGTSTTRPHPSESAGVDTSLIGTPVDVVVGGGFSCALNMDGEVYCWGQNWALGDGTGSARMTPTGPVMLSAPALAIGASRDSACALVDTHDVFCWGLGTDGVLGNGAAVPSPIPTQVTGLSGVSTLASGHHNHCAIAGGGVYCWGWGMYQVPLTTTPALAPRRIALPVGAVPYAVTVNATVACARTTNAGLVTDYCWGSNDYGQLGGGSPLEPGPGPVAVAWEPP